MNSTSRLTPLAVIGVALAGLPPAGWLLFTWAAGEGATSGQPLAWMALALQVALTAALAAAVGWQVRRATRHWQQALDRLQQQIETIDQGPVAVVADPAPALEQCLDTAVLRVQTRRDRPQPAVVACVRRAGAESRLHSRFGFLRRLTDRLADPQTPETALLQVKRLSLPRVAGQPAATATSSVDLADLLNAFAQQVPGTLVGRLGDGDFGLCLPSHGQVEETAASLMAITRAAPRPLRCAIGGVDDLGGVPLGRALTLLDAAAAAAAAAVRKGAVGIVCHSARQPEAPLPADRSGRRAIVEALRDGRYRLGAYPVLDKAGQVLHLECPLRLQLRVGGPYEHAHRWLDEASRYRLMTQIDLAALELALAACAEDGKGRCVHVAAESLATAGFVSAVRSRLEAAPQAAAQVWIEISELSFERLPPQLRNAGTVWRRCGARVGIEHAGVALRNLVRLGDLDLDYVKVDRAFVQGLAADKAQRERARALVDLAHDLGARVIAEGCDDDADLPALWALGFDGATGAAATQRQAVASRPSAGTPRADQAISPA